MGYCEILETVAEKACCMLAGNFEEHQYCSDLTLMLLVANLADTKRCKKNKKLLKP